MKGQTLFGGLSANLQEHGVSQNEQTSLDVDTVCQSCGACCDYSADWPRFTLETDEEIALVPSSLISANGGRMRCNGDRCCALKGEVGKVTACSVYAVRPIVCRECEPGDEACTIARTARGLPALKGRFSEASGIPDLS